MTLLRRAENYRILSRIGAGRYGVCYLARDDSGRTVVLKRFRSCIHGRKRPPNADEAVILSSLEHECLPELLGVLNTRKGYFFILEYMEGASLEKLLFRRRKRFGDAEIFRIGSQLLTLLVYLHKRHIVHRDISIANVLDNGEQVFLIDFGLAQFSDDFTLDWESFGNLLLYLLYSSYEGKTGGAWYEELTLSPEKTTCLKRLLGLAPPFSDTEEILLAFSSCFAVP